MVTLTQASLALINGVQTITLPDGDSGAQLAQTTGSQRYFVVLDLYDDWASQTDHNGIAEIQITHITENSSTAEDPTNDGPLQMQFTANITSTATPLDAPDCFTPTIHLTGTHNSTTVTLHLSEDYNVWRLSDPFGTLNNPATFSVSQNDTVTDNSLASQGGNFYVARPANCNDDANLSNRQGVFSFELEPGS